MTDQELIARLRRGNNGQEIEAAERIEELVKERDEARHLQSCACNYDTPTDVCMGHHALFERLYAVEREKLEAKLTKAGTLALETILNERGPVFDAMVDAAEDAAGKDVSFNVVVGRAIRAALAALEKTE